MSGTIYLAAVALSIESTERGPQKAVLGAQQLIAAAYLGAFAFAAQLLGSQLSFHFDQLTQDLSAAIHKASAKPLSGSAASGLVKRYLVLREETQALDSILRWPALWASVGWLVTGTFASYAFLVREDKMDMEAMHILTLLLIQLSATLILFFSAFHVQDASRAVKEELLVTPRSQFALEARPWIRVMENVAADTDWSLSVGGLYSLDRGVILTIMGIIISHTIVLYELGSYESSLTSRSDSLLVKLSSQSNRYFGDFMNETWPHRGHSKHP